LFSLLQSQLAKEFVNLSMSKPSQAPDPQAAHEAATAHLNLLDAGIVRPAGPEETVWTDILEGLEMGDEGDGDDENSRTLIMRVSVEQPYRPVNTYRPT